MKYRAPVEARTQKFHMRYLDLLREIARKNRKEPTESENRIWQVLFRNRKINEKFTRQKPLGRFILDFYCSKLLLAIEIDGDSHDKKKYMDNERDLYLEQRGITTIRYRNEQVLNNIDDVYNDLIIKIKKREIELCVSPLSRGDVRKDRGV
jgi:very-short-patch-repair endonuclease